MSNKHRSLATRSNPGQFFEIDGTEVRFYEDDAVLIPCIAADRVASIIEFLLQGPSNSFLCTPWRLYSVSIESQAVSAFETARPYAYAALLHGLRTHPQGWPDAPAVLDLLPFPRKVYVVGTKGRTPRPETDGRTLH